VLSGFHKLATCLSWAALNGTSGGQDRLFSVLPFCIMAVFTFLWMATGAALE
jgi:hypothetical protein